MEERILELFRTRPKEILFADAIADAILHEEYEGVYPKDPAAPSASSDELQERFFAEVTRAIKHLVSSGRLMMSKSGRVGLPEAFGYVLGIILINDKGYGFFRPVGGGSDRKKDVFVRKTDMKGALHRDTVLVKIKHSSRGAEAEISKIVKRATETFIGTFEGREVIPNDKKIYRGLLVTENPAGAKPGDVVMVQVTAWGDVTRAIRCRITEILGRKGDKGIDILSIAKQFGLEAAFPEAVLQEAERLSEEFPVGTRADYRMLPTVTIDGADAKDIDDAISLEILGGKSAGESGESEKRTVKYRLYVHIADVSHYVTPGSELDREAQRRGTSSYLLDRVIPMLPAKLSNHLCSLNAGEDRYALTCVMDCAADGGIIGHEIVKSVINVDARLEYSGVSLFLNDMKRNNSGESGRDIAQVEKEVEKCTAFSEMLHAMEELSVKMRKKRGERGAVDFDFPEPVILLDDDGVPYDILRRERDAASLMIEDFMLAANETVAEHFYWLEIPFIYRVHEAPSPEKIEELKRYISFFGVSLKGKNENTGIARLIRDIKGEQFEMAVSREALRSMMQARYAEECLGHFGLAAKYYTHFTAPIRRYPDLFAHRIISNHLATLQNPHLSDSVGSGITVDECAAVAELSSECERNAESAERKVEAMKMAEYMEGHIGELFEGTVSGVTSYGVFVQLDNLVEGLVHVTLMPDDEYEYDEERLTLTGLQSGEVFAVGDRAEVLVAAANGETGKVDFSLVENFQLEKKARGRSFRGGRKNGPERHTGGKHKGGKNGGEKNAAPHRRKKDKKTKGTTKGGRRKK